MFWRLLLFYTHVRLLLHPSVLWLSIVTFNNDAKPPPEWILRQFDVFRIRPRLGGLPHLKTFILPRLRGLPGLADRATHSVFCSFSLSTVVMAKFMSSIRVDLGAHSFFPTPRPFKIYLCLVTMACGCATFARRVMKYTTPDKLKSSRRTGKHASKF